MSNSYIKSFRAAALPIKLRSMLDFAEQEIILPPGGPRAGLRFRTDFMPFTRGVLEEFDRGRYRRFFGSGPVQGGKTLLFLGIPAIYFPFERGEHVIIGVPDLDVAQDVFESKILPVIEMTRYRELMPTYGAGSRGGRFKKITFKNGAVMRFMSAAGKDHHRSTHTARVIIMTELDKMDEAGGVSREADPVIQFERRAAAHGSEAIVFGECTMSIETGRVYQEVSVYGTDTKVYTKCPHCGEYITPDREHFIGYVDAADVITAREAAGYACNACGAVWTETERTDALKRPVFAARGQTVTRDGKIDGDAPRTLTFGFRWNAMHSALTTMADLGEKEWRAEQSGHDSDMRDVIQFSWVQPYTGRMLDTSEVSAEAILRNARLSDYNSGRVGRMPFEYDPKRILITGGIDVHKRFLVAVFDAWEIDIEKFLLQSWRLDFLIPYDYLNSGAPDAIYQALVEVRDTLNQGWEDENGTKVYPQIIGIDSGYQDTKKYKKRITAGADYQVYRFCKKFQQGTWRACKGEAELDEGITKRSYLEREGVHLWLIDTDLAKCELQAMLNIPLGQPGYFHLPKDTPRGYARGIASERRVVGFDKDNHEYAKWIVTDPYNHPLDAAVYSWAMARTKGVRPPRGGVKEK